MTIPTVKVCFHLYTIHYINRDTYSFRNFLLKNFTEKSKIENTAIKSSKNDDKKKLEKSCGQKRGCPCEWGG